MLPMPHETTIRVIRKVPGCESMRWWEVVELRPEAYVATLSVPSDEEGDCDYSEKEWEAVSERLERDYPDCMFAYS